MKKLKMYATVGKPSELLELFSAMNYYNIDEVYITITNKSRIDKGYIGSFFEKKIPGKNYFFLDFDFSNSVSDYREFLMQYIESIDYFSLSLYYNRHLYKISPFLKKKGKKIIHISDGITNAFSMFGYVLGFRTKGLFSFLKGMYIYFEYKKAKADVTFFALYPNKCCFSKETLPLTELKTNYPENIKHIADCDTLIVPGWGMETNDLVAFFDINEKYCASSKELSININGTHRKLEHYITAEDIINYGTIKRIIGTPSTALIFAKSKYPEIQVDCVLTGELNKTYGLFYEREYIKLGKKIGVNFYNYG